jgi:hypothetical protein
MCPAAARGPVTLHVSWYGYAVHKKAGNGRGMPP